MIRDLLASWRTWLRYRRTGRPPAQDRYPLDANGEWNPPRSWWLGRLKRQPADQSDARMVANLNRALESTDPAIRRGITNILLAASMTNTKLAGNPLDQALRPCPFCGRPAETNGIAVWCPTLTHGLMTRDDWQRRTG